jgi:hypothetical protein
MKVQKSAARKRKRYVEIMISKPGSVCLLEKAFVGWRSHSYKCPLNGEANISSSNNAQPDIHKIPIVLYCLYTMIEFIVCVTCCCICNYCIN